MPDKPLEIRQPFKAPWVITIQPDGGVIITIQGPPKEVYTLEAWEMVAALRQLARQSEAVPREADQEHEQPKG